VFSLLVLVQLLHGAIEIAFLYVLFFQFRKQISELKKREITGSGIFSHESDNEEDTPLVAKVNQV
jgi:hypothetical protein